MRDLNSEIIPADPSSVGMSSAGGLISSRARRRRITWFLTDLVGAVCLLFLLWFGLVVGAALS